MLSLLSSVETSKAVMGIYWDLYLLSPSLLIPHQESYTCDPVWALHYDNNNYYIEIGKDEKYLEMLLRQILRFCTSCKLRVDQTNVSIESAVPFLCWNLVLSSYIKCTWAS